MSCGLFSESSESSYTREFAALLKQHHRKEPLQKIFSMTKETALVTFQSLPENTFGVF